MSARGFGRETTDEEDSRNIQGHKQFDRGRSDQNLKKLPNLEGDYLCRFKKFGRVYVFPDRLAFNPSFNWRQATEWLEFVNLHEILPSKSLIPGVVITTLDGKQRRIRFPLFGGGGARSKVVRCWKSFLTDVQEPFVESFVNLDGSLRIRRNVVAHQLLRTGSEREDLKREKLGNGEGAGGSTKSDLDSDGGPSVRSNRSLPWQSSTRGEDDEPSVRSGTRDHMDAEGPSVRSDRSRAGVASERTRSQRAEDSERSRPKRNDESERSSRSRRIDESERSEKTQSQRADTSQRTRGVPAPKNVEVALKETERAPVPVISDPVSVDVSGIEPEGTRKGAGSDPPRPERARRTFRMYGQEIEEEVDRIAQGAARRRRDDPSIRADAGEGMSEKDDTFRTDRADMSTFADMDDMTLRESMAGPFPQHVRESLNGPLGQHLRESLNGSSGLLRESMTKPFAHHARQPSAGGSAPPVRNSFNGTMTQLRQSGTGGFGADEVRRSYPKGLTEQVEAVVASAKAAEEAKVRTDSRKPESGRPVVPPLTGIALLRSSISSVRNSVEAPTPDPSNVDDDELRKKDNKTDDAAGKDGDDVWTVQSSVNISESYFLDSGRPDQSSKMESARSSSSSESWRESLLMGRNDSQMDMSVMSVDAETPEPRVGPRRTRSSQDLDKEVVQVLKSKSRPPTPLKATDNGALPFNRRHRPPTPAKDGVDLDQDQATPADTPTAGERDGPDLGRPPSVKMDRVYELKQGRRRATPTEIDSDGGDTPVPEDTPRPDSVLMTELDEAARDTTPLSVATLVSKFQTCSLIRVLGEKEVPLVEYVVAMRELIKVFAMLGSGMAFIKTDMVSKADCLSEHYAKHSDEYTTVQAMARSEMVRGTVNRPQSGTWCAIRLAWALEFMLVLAEVLTTQEMAAMTMPECATVAFDTALSRHYPWGVRQIARAAMPSIMSRGKFLSALGDTESTSMKQLSRFRHLARPTLFSLKAFHGKHGLEEI